MTDDGLPRMEPLAPIIDQMREIAQEEIPSPRTCRIRLWDDGTFDAYIFHLGSTDEGQCIRYDRSTSEITWEYFEGQHYETHEFSGGDTLHVPAFEEHEVRVITTVEPPYK